MARYKTMKQNWEKEFEEEILKIIKEWCQINPRIRNKYMLINVLLRKVKEKRKDVIKQELIEKIGKMKIRPCYDYGKDNPNMAEANKIYNQALSDIIQLIKEKL